MATFNDTKLGDRYAIHGYLTEITAMDSPDNIWLTTVYPISFRNGVSEKRAFIERWHGTWMSHSHQPTWQTPASIVCSSCLGVAK